MGRWRQTGARKKGSGLKEGEGWTLERDMYVPRLLLHPLLLDSVRDSPREENEKHVYICAEKDRLHRGDFSFIVGFTLVIAAPPPFE